MEGEVEGSPKTYRQALIFDLLMKKKRGRSLAGQGTNGGKRGRPQRRKKRWRENYAVPKNLGSPRRLRLFYRKKNIKTNPKRGEKVPSREKESSDLKKWSQGEVEAEPEDHILGRDASKKIPRKNQGH